MKTVLVLTVLPVEATVFGGVLEDENSVDESLTDLALVLGILCELINLVRAAGSTSFTKICK